MKFLSLFSAISLLAALTSVTALPRVGDTLSLERKDVSLSESSGPNNDIKSIASSSVDENNALTADDAAVFARDLSRIEQRTGQQSSKVKFQVLAAGGRILSTIIINYTISLLPGGETMTATFSPLTTPPGIGPIHATYFEPVGGNHVPDVVLDFANAVISGAFQLLVNPTTGQAFEAGSTSPLFSKNTAATTLKIFNAAGAMIGTMNVN